MHKNIEIRKAKSGDMDSIWTIIQKVIASGDTYVFTPDSSRASMLAYWYGDDKQTYVATVNEIVVGTFIIKDNLPGLGAHVANASYMTLPDVRGLGIGTSMTTYSLDEARRLGYWSMQFNIVVKSNHNAIKLWQKLGFTTIGEIPDAFNHQQNGLTNAYIMWRKL